MPHLVVGTGVIDSIEPSLLLKRNGDIRLARPWDGSPSADWLLLTAEL